MGDLTKILDGNVDEVKGALAGLSHVDLLALRKEEEAGQNRKGVLHAVDAALEATPGEAQSPVGVDQAASDADNGVTSPSADAISPADAEAPAPTSEPAADQDNGVAPADTIDTSGAPQQIVPDVDMSSPAVDADPRANTTAEQNRIDFNDPTIDGREAVEKNLAGQAKG